NSGNQLLENNGKSIHKGLPADFDWWRYKVLPRSDDAVAIWADYRHSNLGAQIYFQFINPDGSVDFTPNGKPITLSPAEYSNEFDAIVTPDDQIAIVWLDHNMIKAQLLDSSGMPLWGNDGMDVAIDPVIYKNSPKISYENGAFYIGWSQVHQAINNYHLLRITGQKLVNGIRQWGDNGIALSEDIQNEMFDSCLSQIVGRYFVWNKSYFSGDLTGSSVKMVKLVNPDGTAATGWSEAGLPASDIMGEYYTPNEAKAVATSAGLCLVWRDSRDNWIPNLYGQMISPQGIKLWNPNGIRFSDINNNVNEYDVLVRNDNLYLIWSEDVLSTNFNTTDIKLKRINLSGQSQSGEQGIVLSAGGQYIQNTNPVLQIFPNGGMLAAWEHKYYNTVLFISADNLIKHRYLNPDGSVDNTQINEVWTTVDSDTQNYPKTAIVGNDAYLFWVDADFYHNSDRCGPDYLDTRDLYVMKLSNEITSVDDEVVPLAGFTLKQNYPNPFRSETNIRFSLKQNAAVDLSVYNLKGQKITTLKHGLLDKGSHNLLWNGTDTNKTSVASGVYFIKLHSGNTTLTRKMVLMR
ncbi:MAG: T9SS type A sorting domain-containing protein, partial [Candidatus Cloacimonetes bacterium]|nr:T9SS type A sorting domain-containing protein [Candidatus Cloacimonadota bacterium]